MSLLTACALPGCETLVALPGEVCDGCRAAFGEMLQHNPAGAPLTAEEINDRDQAVRDMLRERKAAVPADPKRERRRNQTCWLCEERRTCTRMPAGWECDSCLIDQPTTTKEHR